MRSAARNPRVLAPWLRGLSGLALALLLASCASVPVANPDPLRVGVTLNYQPLIFRLWDMTAGAENDFAVALAKELGPSGIQVNCVAPGVIQTGMIADLDEETLLALKEETPLGKIGSPEDIAACILYLASEKADFITGQVISVDGGLFMG